MTSAEGGGSRPTTGLPLPGRQTLGGLLLRIFRSRRSIPPVHYWAIFAGLPAASAFVLLFVLNGWWNGWGCAYDLMLAITSPWNKDAVRLRWLALPLSFAGWLLMPALVGGVLGFTVNRGLTQHRMATVDEVKAELVRQARRSATREVNRSESDHSPPP